MRSLEVALPAEQYFANTAAKISPGRTLRPGYTRCSGSSVRAQAFLSGCPNVLRDTLKYNLSLKLKSLIYSFIDFNAT